MVGFVQSEIHPAHWKACTDIDTLLDTPRKRCIVAGTRREALAVLAKRFKSSHPELQRVLVSSTTYGYRDGQQANFSSDDRAAGPDDVITVHADALYYGTDVDEAISLAKELGTVHCADLTRSYFGGTWNRREKAQLYDAGCHLSGTNGIVYAPKRARSLQRAAGSKRRRMPVRIDTIVAAAAELARDLSRNGVDIQTDCNYSRWSASRVLTRVVFVYNLVYGRHAHRQSKAFQSLKLAWKRNRESSRKNWVADGPLLCEWMDYEITRRKPKSRDLSTSARCTSFCNPLAVYAHA